MQAFEINLIGTSTKNPERVQISVNLNSMSKSKDNFSENYVGYSNVYFQIYIRGASTWRLNSSTGVHRYFLSQS